MVPTRRILSSGAAAPTGAADGRISAPVTRQAAARRRTRAGRFAMGANSATHGAGPLETTRGARLERARRCLDRRVDSGGDAPRRPRDAPVMVFNIEEGGVGVDLGKVVEAIRRADPDVVALQEAMGNTARIADALGWGFASHRSQVLSPHPVVDPPVGRRRVRVRRGPARPGRGDLERPSAGRAVRPGAGAARRQRRGGDRSRATRPAAAARAAARRPAAARGGRDARSSWSATSTRRRTWTGRRRPSGSGPTSGRSWTGRSVARSRPPGSATPGARSTRTRSPSPG